MIGLTVEWHHWIFVLSDIVFVVFIFAFRGLAQEVKRSPQSFFMFFEKT